MSEFFDFFSKAPILFLDWSVHFLSQVPWYWILIFSALVTFIENIFPPSPSDSILLFTGSLVVVGNVGFTELLLCSTIGSVLGFVVMYQLGFTFGKRIIDSNRFSFINSETLKKPEEWFLKYGYYLIIANRFLSGTRAVISFFAGISKIDLKKTVILSAVSAGIWNFFLIWLGIVFADNLDLVKEYIGLYGKIIFPLIILAILIYSVKYFFFTKKENNEV